MAYGAEAPAMKPIYVFRRVGRLLLIFAGRATPTDDEFDQVLREFALPRAELATLKVLIFTKGTAPTAPQRKRLQDILGGVLFPTAVVSDSIKIRFVAAAIVLFHKDHRAFARSEIDGALDYLQLTGADRRAAKEASAEANALVE